MTICYPPHKISKVHSKFAIDETVVDLSSSALCASRLMNGNELQNPVNIQGEDSSPYLASDLGTGFLHQLGSTYKQITFLQNADKLSSAISQIDYALADSAGFLSDKLSTKFAVDLGFCCVHFEFIGRGHFASALLVKIEDMSFVLKCFYRRPKTELLPSGPWTETALAMWATSQCISDMPHILLANPESGWMLMEYITPAFIEKSGPSASDLGLTSLDENRAINHITTKSGKKIRVDYGHLHSEKRARLSPPSSFIELSMKRKGWIPYLEQIRLFDETAESRIWSYHYLKRIEPNLRINFIQLTMEYDEVKYFPLLDFFESNLLPNSQILNVLNLYYRHSDPIVRSRAFCNPKLIKARTAKSWSEKWDREPIFAPLRICRGSYSEFSTLLERTF